MKKTLEIWVAVNKNGDVRMFADEPVRNNDTGKWESKHPFVNCIMQKEFEELCTKTKITWEMDPNPFVLNIE